jgi:hypothetical protein
MFSLEALTPYVSTQWGVGTFERPSGSGMSRLGAEAYGGRVSSLSSTNILTPESQVSRYADWSNLANYAQQVPSEKKDVPGAYIPWSIGAETPTAAYMSYSGMGREIGISKPMEIQKTGVGREIAPGMFLTGSLAILTPQEIAQRTETSIVPSPITTTIENIFGKTNPIGSGLAALSGSIFASTKVTTTTTPANFKTQTSERMNTPVESALLSLPGPSDLATLLTAPAAYVTAKTLAGVTGVGGGKQAEIPVGLTLPIALTTESYLKGVGEASETASRMVEATPLPAVGPVSKYNLEVGVGIASAFAALPSVITYAPVAAEWALRNPERITSKAAAIGSDMFGGIITSEMKHPGTGVGQVMGIAVSGKATGAVGEAIQTRGLTLGGIAETYSPVLIDISTPVKTFVTGEANYYTTIYTRNPLRAEPPTPKAYIATGAGFEKPVVGRGSPVEVMKGTEVGPVSLFNVRAPELTPSPAQMRLLEPFYKEVSKGAPESALVSSVFDIKSMIQRSEPRLQYTTEQPVGTLKQVGVSPAVQAEVHEVIARAGGIRLGSSALTEFVGSKHARDTTLSDIDVDLPKAKYAETLTELTEAYRQNPKPVVSNGGLFGLKEKLKGGVTLKEEHILGAGEIEKHLDVRSYTAYTQRGTPIGQQTPEYGIESKASRLFGRGSEFSYTPAKGVTVALGGGKTAADIADIYASSRGIAKTAYMQRYYDIGKRYESISKNLEKYAKQSGVSELIETIPEDILKGVPRGPVKAGSILGVGIDVGTTAGRAEYPIYTPRAVESATPRLYTGSTGYEYPTARQTQVSGNYPIGMQPSQYPVLAAQEYPTRVVTGNYPTSITTGMNYPTITGTPIDYPALTPITGYPPSTPLVPTEYPPFIPTPTEYPPSLKPPTEYPPHLPPTTTIPPFLPPTSPRKKKEESLNKGRMQTRKYFPFVEWYRVGEGVEWGSFMGVVPREPPRFVKSHPRIVPPIPTPDKVYSFREYAPVPQNVRNPVQYKFIEESLRVHAGQGIAPPSRASNGIYRRRMFVA